jgi:hypothetical protein
MTLASARQENSSTASSSSRTREFNDSTYGFCHGDPGSMYAVPVWEKRHQSRSAFAVSSGPLSQRMNSGARPAERDQVLECDDGGVGVDAPFALHRKRLAGELVNDVQQLHDPPVGGLVELEVKRPHLIRAHGAKPARRHRRLAQALALAAALRDPQALLAPQPLRALAIQRPAVLE